MAEGIAVNKKALHDYDILEKLEAGIVLTGAETKSAKTGGLNLRGAHTIIRGGEAYIVGAQISAYKSGHQGDDYDPAATRKLLLKRAEIDRLSKAEGVSRSDVVRESIREYLFIRRFRAMRRDMLAKAARRGVHADQDVFNRVS